MADQDASLDAACNREVERGTGRASYEEDDRLGRLAGGASVHAPSTAEV